VVSIQEIQGIEGQVVTMAEIFRFTRLGVGKSGEVQGRFEATGLVPRLQDRLRLRGIELDMTLFQPGRALG
jgi:pilus assembly protein CpaF